MGTYSGRNAKVKIGTSLVAEMASWSLDETGEEIDTTVFGSGWGKSDQGMKRWRAVVDGFCDPADAQQDTLRSAFLDGNLVADIRFYLDNTKYYCPDVTTDPDAGGRVVAYNIAVAKDGVASLHMEISGSGPIGQVLS